MKFEQPHAPEKKSYEGYTGTQFEEELLSEIRCDWDTAGYIRAANKRDYIAAWAIGNIPDMKLSSWRSMSYEQQREYFISWVKDNQPEDWNTTHPVSQSSTAIADLKYFIEEALGVEAKYLHCYTSLHTPIDTLNGIDAFFEFGGVRATLDATLNPMKFEHGVRFDKADFVLGPEDVVDEVALEKLGKRIAAQMKRDLQKLSTQPATRTAQPNIDHKGSFGNVA